MLYRFPALQHFFFFGGALPDLLFHRPIVGEWVSREDFTSISEKLSWLSLCPMGFLNFLLCFYIQAHWFQLLPSSELILQSGATFPHSYHLLLLEMDEGREEWMLEIWISGSYTLLTLAWGLLWPDFLPLPLLLIFLCVHCLSFQGLDKSGAQAPQVTSWAENPLHRHCWVWTDASSATL